jgi:hypothetical protein
MYHVTSINDISFSSSFSRISQIILPNLKTAFYREIPRVFMIYDIDMPVEVAKLSIRRKFTEKASLKDESIIDRLIDLGYMELESVLLQHKQRSHLMYTLEGQEGIFGETSGRKQLPPNASIDDQFNRN